MVMDTPAEMALQPERCSGLSAWWSSQSAGVVGETLVMKGVEVSGVHVTWAGVAVVLSAQSWPG